MKSIVEPSPQDAAVLNAPKGARRAVTVVGAGFSGLTVALYLHRLGFQVEVIEKSDRVGGMIGTIEAPFGRVETAANAILNSPRVEELFTFLGLAPTAPQKLARRRFIYRDHFPRRWPIGVSASIRLVWFLLRFMLVRSRLSPRASENVRHWAERVLGKENSKYLVEAALQGIYAGDPSRLSASLIFGKYFRRHKESQRLGPKSIRGSVSAPKGMGQVVEALRFRLEKLGVTFRLLSEFAPLTRTPTQPLIIATSAPEAERIVAGFDPLRAAALAKIEMLNLFSVTACFKEPLPLGGGFGCLFPPAEARRAMGVLFNNYIFPDRVSKGYSETWILGGALEGVRGEKSLVTATDQEIFSIVQDERSEAFHAGVDYHSYRVTRWQPALPHYTVELELLLADLRGLRFNTMLVGNYLGEIGLTRILELSFKVAKEVEQSGDWPGDWPKDNHEMRSGK